MGSGCQHGAPGGKTQTIRCQDCFPNHSSRPRKTSHFWLARCVLVSTCSSSLQVLSPCSTVQLPTQPPGMQHLQPEATCTQRALARILGAPSREAWGLVRRLGPQGTGHSLSVMADSDQAALLRGWCPAKQAWANSLCPRPTSTQLCRTGQPGSEYDPTGQDLGPQPLWGAQTELQAPGQPVCPSGVSQQWRCPLVLFASAALSDPCCSLTHSTLGSPVQPASLEVAAPGSQDLPYCPGCMPITTAECAQQL